MKGTQAITQGLVGAFVLALSTLGAPRAEASEWGCKVLLCLASPNSPTEFAECRPPIEKLYDCLKDPDCGFPSCSMAGGGNYAQQTMNPYPACPSGTKPLANGQKAIVGASGQYQDGGYYYTPVTNTQYSQLNGLGLNGTQINALLGANGATALDEPVPVATGIGDGSLYGLQNAYNPLEGGPPPMLSCVGNQVGTITLNGQQVGIYDDVRQLPPGGSFRAIDVYIQGELYKRVHW